MGSFIRSVWVFFDDVLPKDSAVSWKGGGDPAGEPPAATQRSTMKKMPQNWRGQLKWSLRVATWAASLWFCSLAFAQISPGALSRAHQQLEGVAKCASCHDFGAGARRFKCLECHTEIQRRLQAQTGFHSRAYKSSSDEIDCVRCHLEHNGQNFALTRLDRKTFDHGPQTGFVLEGKHHEQKCESCHTTKKIPAAARQEIKFKELDKSFLGLKRECIACHEDRHTNQLGTDCTHCHTQENWTKTPGFNHSKSSFPLTGLHQRVDCEKCHTSLPKEKEVDREKEANSNNNNDKDAKPVLFKGIEFSNCQSCHKDPHKGAFQEAKFNGSCEKCHTTAGWKNNRPAGNFSHNISSFPLNGKHADVACGKCHKDSDFHRKVEHDKCGSCHEDIHKGQFVSRAEGSDCGSCHNDSGFKPTLFSRETHLKAAFPLREKHSEVECGSCHRLQGKDTVYATRQLLCNSCHAEPHGGEFAKSPWMNRCDTCHTPAGFESNSFTVARHAQTQFPLAGKHTTVACNDCHKPLATAPVSAVAAGSVLLAKLGTAVFPSAQRQFHIASKTCASCHADPHQTQLTCETCHNNPEQWKLVLPFDHSKTKFALDGTHKDANCLQCHNPAGPTASIVATAVPVFSKTPVQCSGCHQDYHGGQFLRTAPQEECSTCHVAVRWKQEHFDHDRTNMPLDRRHVDVACDKCHKDQKEAAGQKFRVYRGTPTDCVKCH